MPADRLGGSTINLKTLIQATESTEEKQTVISKLRPTLWVSQQIMEKPFLSPCPLCSLWLIAFFMVNRVNAWWHPAFSLPACFRVKSAAQTVNPTETENSTA